MQAAKLEVKEEGGQLVILAIGRTGRGISFVKSSKALQVKTIADKNFKTEMAAAVIEMLGSEA